MAASFAPAYLNRRPSRSRVILSRIERDTPAQRAQRVTGHGRRLYAAAWLLWRGGTRTHRSPAESATGMGRAGLTTSARRSSRSGRRRDRTARDARRRGGLQWTANTYTLVGVSLLLLSGLVFGAVGEAVDRLRGRHGGDHHHGLAGHRVPARGRSSRSVSVWACGTPETTESAPDESDPPDPVLGELVEIVLGGAEGVHDVPLPGAVVAGEPCAELAGVTCRRSRLRCRGGRLVGRRRVLARVQCARACEKAPRPDRVTGAGLCAQLVAGRWGGGFSGGRCGGRRRPGRRGRGSAGQRWPRRSSSPCCASCL
jgi:hypothetical protein